MPSASKPGWLPVTAATLSIVIGLAVLVFGWGLGFRWFLAPLPGGVAMMPITAAVLAIYGVGLLVGVDPQAREWSRRLGQVLVGAVILLNCLIFVSIAIESVGGNPFPLLPARLSVAAGIPHLFNGLALFHLLQPRGKWSRPVVEQILTLVSMLVVLPIFLGVVLTFGHPGETATHSILAAHSAMTMLILSVGIFFSRPYAGTPAGLVMADSLAGQVLRRLLLAGVGLPLLGGASERLMSNLGFPVALHLGVFATVQVIVLCALALYVGWILNGTERSRNLAERDRTDALRQLEYQAAMLQETVSRRTVELSQALAYNQRLALVASHTTDAVYITDAAGEAQWLNDRFSRLFGYALADIQGRRASYLLEGPLSAQGVLGRMRRRMETAEGGRSEIVLYSKAGNPFWCDVEMEPVFEKDRVLTGWVISLSDIQARKAAEDQLRAAKDEADQLNVQLENAIAQAQQSATEANIGSQAKSAFLATMSHEIRTPLNGIIGMAGLLRDTGLDARQMDFARTIETSGDALLAIINDVLDYSKIEAGRIELERAPFDLRLCIDAALDIFSAKVTEKNIELLCSVEATVPPVVVGDSARLRQVIVNLVGNALKFTATGEVVVNVSATTPVPGSANELTFSVRDTGIGIPADRRDRLFQPFSQVDSSTTRKFGGSGLGLAISRRLAEAMGGRMWVESEPGHGSVFSFTIVVPSEHHAITPRTEPPSVLAGKTVLIVDDNLAAREWMAARLTDWGVRPLLASDATQAMETLAAGAKCDVVLIDRQMPGIDGLQLGSDLRKLRSAETLPLVLLSSLAENVASDLFAAFITKPLKAVNLHEALKKVLGRNSTSPVPVAAVSPRAPDLPISPIRMLLVEDNPVNQRVATMLLAKLGYQARLAQNGAEALTATLEETFDVILMDMEMPVMDGCEATRRIRENATATRPWIVALTANAMNSDRQRAFKAGMNDFVAKPIRASDLDAALKRAYAVVTGIPLAAEAI